MSRQRTNRVLSLVAGASLIGGLLSVFASEKASAATTIEYDCSVKVDAADSQTVAQAVSNMKDAVSDRCEVDFLLGQLSSFPKDPTVRVVDDLTRSVLYGANGQRRRARPQDQRCLDSNFAVYQSCIGFDVGEPTVVSGEVAVATISCLAALVDQNTACGIPGDGITGEGLTCAAQEYEKPPHRNPFPGKKCPPTDADDTKACDKFCENSGQCTATCSSQPGSDGICLLFATCIACDELPPDDPFDTDVEG